MSDEPETRTSFEDELAARLRESNERIEVPIGLVDRIEARLSEEAPRPLHWWWTVPLAAAAVVTLAFILRTAPAPPPAAPEVAIAPDAPVAHDPVVPVAHVTRLTFDRSDGFFAREVETTRPDVSIFLVYRDAAPPLAGDANEQLDLPRSNSS
jgi:hypothetical protein